MSRKRKHGSTLSDSIVFSISASNPGPTGPLLVSYPAIEAPPSTAFQCYANKRAKTQEKSNDQAQQPVLLVGETDGVEFISNDAETQQVANSGCRYLIAIHNRRSSKLSILPTSKSPFILSRTVKALKSIRASEPTLQEYLQARNSLGEAFGTKKAKASINARERNRVDVNAMKGVMDHLQQGIDTGAAGLMTTEQAKEEADKNRLIPPFDASAKDADDVYHLHGIIPETEWKALSETQFYRTKDPDMRKTMLYWNKSQWVNSHLDAKPRESQSTKRTKRDLKIVLYISAMLDFRQAMMKRDGVNKDELSGKLSRLPGVILDGLLSRFTETPRGSTTHLSTSATQTKLLTYIFALCLKVDNFATNTTVVAHDLGKPITEVITLFRSLGCKISQLNEQECARLGLSYAPNTRRAVLSAPVVFPKPRARRK